MLGLPHMSFVGDLRYGFRALARTPGFTVAAALIMALGIGANSAVFSIVNTLLLRPLPGLADPSRLTSLYRVQKGQIFDNFSYPDYVDYRDRSRTLQLAAHLPVIVSLRRGGRGRRINGDLVSDNYFATLGVRPAAGRLPGAGEAQAAVIGYAFWQREFGGDPAVIGAGIDIDGYPFTIAGVAARDFRGSVLSFPVDVWFPMNAQPKVAARLSNAILQNRSAGWLQLFGRLRPGATVEGAAAEMKMPAAQLARENPLIDGARTACVAAGVGTYPDDLAEVTGLLRLLWGAVALLLLIACANVAGLLLVRAGGRTREIAVRLAIGAGPARIVRQLVAEGLALALLAGVAGILLAAWAGPAIASAGQSSAMSLVRHAGARIDGSVLAFTLAATLLTGLLFALAPALAARKVELVSALKSGLPGSGLRGTRFRSALVAGQIGLSFVLLSGAGLLFQSLHRILTTNQSFDLSGVAMASVDLSLDGFTPAEGQRFYRDLLASLNTRPGVSSATVAGTVPPTEFPGTAPVFYPGQEPPPELLQAREFELGLRVTPDVVGPRYFETLRIPLVEGRDFDARESETAPKVAIVSRALAKRMWPHESAIGKRIAYPQWGGPWRPPFEVVGVAGDVRHRTLTGDAPLLLYLPVTQNYSGAMRILVRMASKGRPGASVIESSVAAVNENVAVFGVHDGNDWVGDSLWQQRTAAWWIGIFGAIALLMAAVGLYGVIAQTVAQRTREIGIRMALGASASETALAVLRRAIAVTGLGIAAGIPAALAAGRLASTYLEGVGSLQLSLLIAASALLLGVAAAASWGPAMRAGRTDPVRALRWE